MLPAEIAAFETGSFELKCPRMTLRQEGTDTPLEYKGPGLIRQDSGRHLQFQLFASSEPEGREFCAFPEGRLQPGQLLPERHYYALSAVDLSGQEWHSTRVRADRDVGCGLVLSGALEQITCSAETSATGHLLKLTVIGNLIMPFNRRTREEVTVCDEKRISWQQDAAQFEACGCDVLIRRRNNRKVLIRVESKGPSFPADAETRVIEGLQFVLGRSIWWSLMFRTDGGAEMTCLRSERGKALPRLDPPISIESQPFGDTAWTLCRAYLEHIWHFGQEEFHPVSAWLGFVRNASTGSIFAKGLALGVAVEGVLWAAFPGVGSSPDPQAIKALRGHVASWEGDVAIRERLLGAIDAMRQRRAKDMLFVLSSLGVVTKKQIDAWDKLRNSTAHARPPEHEEWQEWIDLCFEVEVMLYRLIFEAIGYTGEYTDYTEKGWPQRRFVASRRQTSDQ